jgi:tight adherence protein C
MGFFFESDFLFRSVAFLAAFLGVAGVGMALLDRRPSPLSRLRAMDSARAAAIAEKSSQRKERTGVSAGAGRVVRRLGGAVGRAVVPKGSERWRKMRSALARAGFRSQSAVSTYLFLRLAFPVCLAALSLLYARSALQDARPWIPFAVLAGSIVFGLFLPPILLANAGMKRRSAILRSFPDALDLLVICVEAGLSMDVALMRVCEEAGAGDAEMAEEIGMVAAELAYLGDRRRAWDNFAERTDIPPAKALSTAMIQAESYGTPVGQALRVLSQETREARMAAAERKAASLPAKLTVPMILFFLPVLFIVIVGPAAIQMTRM